MKGSSGTIYRAKKHAPKLSIEPCEIWPMNAPTPDEIKEARADAGLTQEQAANKIFSGSYRSWQNYERGEREMHPAIWWCFMQRTKRLRRK